ncbi:protein of unknown function [Saccharopolyspora antimicrobica]|uniref:Uncharacterized protein DUF397 n=1 Tax=Saccharopolyspora antimicrobica TaxID=455193 RepID=A0A1I4VKD7_9PSEU|nr:DUF397 domain-containing protein [Saccharopolyspora antimicrobica]RKT86356.1 uncharacterized protein DUF397 [Saccharopolyspora antimicrobica]SFN01712.1 protein of unknown function [Saccharopolyspora antimicrobica]
MTSTPPTFAEHDFRKASASQPNKECVRVARRDGWVELRDDKTAFGAPDDHRLVFTEAQFDQFLTSTRSGQTSGLCLEMTRRTDGMYAFRSTVPQPGGTAAELTFTEAEVAAFRDGVTRGEFDRDNTPEMTLCG